MNRLSVADKKRLEIKTDSITKYVATTSSFGGLANIEAIAKFPGNDVCAECGKKQNDWISLEIGCFLCIDCARVHKSLGGVFVNVQSRKHDSAMWELEKITLLEQTGNIKNKEIYENRLPSYYLRPSPDEHTPLIRENFIREKYINKSFLNENRNAVEGEEVVIDKTKHPFFEMPNKLMAVDIEYTGKLIKKSTKSMAILINSYLFLFKIKKDMKPKAFIDIRGCSVDLSCTLEKGLTVYFVEIKDSEGKEHKIKLMDMNKSIDFVHSLRRASVYYTDKTKIGEIDCKKMIISDAITSNAKTKGQLKLNGSKRWVVEVEGVLYVFKKQKSQNPEEAIILRESQLEVVDESKNILLLTAVFGRYKLKFNDKITMDEWNKNLAEAIKKQAINQNCDFQKDYVYKK